MNASILGIVASTNATGLALAHEIGHSCGLKDIYEEHDGTSQIVTGDISHERLPDDWGCDGNARYYPATLNQVGLLRRLLMYGFNVNAQSDLSYGDVYGLFYISTLTGKVWFLDMATIGFADYANRQPIHQ